jgi:hypothetical protein
MRYELARSRKGSGDSRGIGDTLHSGRRNNQSFWLQSASTHILGTGGTQAELTLLVTAPPFDAFPVNTIDLGKFRQVLASKSALFIDFIGKVMCPGR